MSDESQIVIAAQVENEVLAPTVGESLSAAREAQNLSVEDVARSLKIAVRQVEALESGDYTVLPGITFVKGFIRNYAKSLGLDADALLAALQRQMPSGSFQPISSPNQGIEISTSSTKPWLWVVLVLMVVVISVPLLLYEKLNKGIRPADPVVKAVVAPVAPTLPPAAIEAPVIESGVTSLPTPALDAAPIGQLEVLIKQTPDAAKSSGAVPPVAITSGTGSVKMSFSKDAWVEVRDKNGIKIYSQLNRAGSEQMVQGNPPLALVVGHAASVKITYNGKPVDLSPYINVDVARLTLE